MRKKIAVIGSGISGLVSAYMLSQRHEVTLFEKNRTLGGHTCTLDIEVGDQHYAIDTGFIVFNKKTYPHFCSLLNKLNVAIQPSEMSFSYRSELNSLEYNGNNINTLFADRFNLFRPSFYNLIKDVFRFKQDAQLYLSGINHTLSISEFIQNKSYSKIFIDSYLMPMIASIWSQNIADVSHSPADFILSFFDNHGLLNVTQRPVWYVIKGGSRQYIAELIKPFEHNIRLKTLVSSVIRSTNEVTLVTDQGNEKFDAVVFATHSNQTLSLLENPTIEEKKILCAIPYTENEFVLHTDSRIMPKHRLAWASWNFYDLASKRFALTYYMNRLQKLNSKTHFFVSTNLTHYIDPKLILHRLVYAHPCFNQESKSAQRQHSHINGKNNTYFCGAYWGNGFHEDGVKSAMDACMPLGVSL